MPESSPASPESPVDAPAGPRERFEAELRPLLDGLHAFALELVGDPARAEALVADAAAGVYRGWRMMPFAVGLRVALFARLYREAAADGLRPSPAAEADEPTAVGVGAALPAVLTDGDVARARGALPEPYRVPVVLSDLHDMRYSELAEVLGVPEGDARRRLAAGRRLLHRALLARA